MSDKAPSHQSVVVPVDDLAQEIRRVDGNHSLGAGALAEALLPFLSERLAAAPAPSSLAGGARERAARLIDPKAWEFADKFSTGPHAETMRAEVKCETAASLRIAGEVLAALSPEAPARDGVDSLVDRFAAALKDKLHAAAAKYGHDDAWMRDDWRADLIRQLGEHVQKGDPRDVAAYCAFAWHHGWSVADPASAEAVEWSSGDLEDLISDALDDSLDMDWTARDGAKAAMRAFKKEGIVWGGKKLLDALEEVRNVTHPGLGYSSDDAARRAAFSASDAALTPRHEAPAEGAGEEERKAIARIIFPESERVKMDREWGGNRNHSRNRWKQALEQADTILALRARSSAPEAREGEAVAWVPVGLDGIPEWELTYPEDASSKFDPDRTPLRLYTHPAAPSADKLRIAVEALDRIATVDMGGGFLGAEACRQVARQALAALRAEG